MYKAEAQLLISNDESVLGKRLSEGLNLYEDFEQKRAKHQANGEGIYSYESYSN